jgi:hypothetical protein
MENKKMEQQKPHKKLLVHSGAPGGIVVPAPLVMVTKKMVALDEPMF